MSEEAHFDDWLFAMDEKLDQLMEELPEHVTAKLDYSPESLSVLESWLLQVYASTAEVVAADKYLLDRLSCYVGETIRKNAGGLWSIDLVSTNNIYYRLPVLSKTDQPAESPLTMVTASLDRRRGDYMEGILRVMMEE